MMLGGLVGGSATAVFSNDWCCAVLSSSLLGGAFAFILSQAADHSAAIQRHFTGFRRVAIVALFTFVAGLAFRLDQPAAFERVFGIRPPAGVADLRVEKHCLGELSDHVIMLRFTADAKAMQAITAMRGLMPVPQDRVPGNPQGDWEGFLHRVFGDYQQFGGEAWRVIAPMSSPRVYQWSCDSLLDIRLLWDAHSGRAYAIFIQGRAVLARHALPSVGCWPIIKRDGTPRPTP